MSKCVICGEEYHDTSFVLIIRRDGSEAESCAACNELISGLSSERTKSTSIAALKTHAQCCGDYEVRRYLEAIIESADTPENYDKYIQASRQRRPGGEKEKQPRDLHRLVRPMSLVLLIAVAAYGIFRAVMDFISGHAAAGIIGIVLTGVIIAVLLIIMTAVMDALDDVSSIKKHLR